MRWRSLALNYSNFIPKVLKGKYVAYYPDVPSYAHNFSV